MTNWPTEQELKDRFAEQLLRKGDPWLAALAVLGNQNMGFTSQCCSQWPFDPQVKAKKAALIEEFGEEYFLPTKADLARKVWEEAENTRHTSIDRNRNYRLYAEVMGFVSKDGPKNVNASGNITVTLAEPDQKL